MTTAYKTYWEAYGGLKALFRSWYLWLSFVFVLATWPLWSCPDNEGVFSWTETALSVTPSMLGFSLGSMAILLAIGPSTFLKLSQQGGKSSFFMQAIAAFFHFMLIQIIAILLTLMVNSWPYGVLSFFGYFFFIYSISCGLAAAAALVDLAEVKTEADSLDD